MNSHRHRDTYMTCIERQDKKLPDGGGRRLESSQNLSSFYVSFLHIVQIPAAIAIAANSGVCRTWQE